MRMVEKTRKGNRKLVRKDRHLVTQLFVVEFGRQSSGG